MAGSTRPDPRALDVAIRRALTPELLREPYRSRVEAGHCDPTTGHCYVASEAAFHMLGGKAAGWTPMFVRHEGAPHWFLRGPRGEVLDITAAQFRKTVPYAAAKAKGFLTREPSARARTLMGRAQRTYGALVPQTLTVYHGTDAAPFTRFDPSLRGTATDEGYLGQGFYFSTDPQVGRNRKTLLEARVKLRRPLLLELPTWSTDKRSLINDALGTSGLRGHRLTAELEHRGHDGVILDYSPVGYRHKEVVVFRPSQIHIVGPAKR